MRKRVANPGCWPQGPIATLRPLVTAGLLPADFPVTINGISGYSGGGRQMIEDYEAQGRGCARIPALRPDAQAQARPGAAAPMPGSSRDPIMQPAVGNFAQGMITVVPLQLGTLPKVPTGAELHAAIADHYAGLKGGVVEVAPLADRAQRRHRARDLQRHQQDEALCLRQRRPARRHCWLPSTTISARARPARPCRTWT